MKEHSNTGRSKRGSLYLRHVHWQVAFATTRFDPRLISANGPKAKPIGRPGAICRKLLYRIYTILKEDRL